MLGSSDDAACQANPLLPAGRGAVDTQGCLWSDILCAMGNAKESPFHISRYTLDFMFYGCTDRLHLDEFLGLYYK